MPLITQESLTRPDYLGLVVMQGPVAEWLPDVDRLIRLLETISGNDPTSVFRGRRPWYRLLRCLRPGAIAT